MTRRRKIYTQKKRGKVVERRRPVSRKRGLDELWFVPSLCAVVWLAILIIVQGLGMRLRLAIVTATCAGVVPVIVLIVALLVKEFMPEIETWTRMDLNRDGVIGDPRKQQPAEPTVIQTNNKVKGTPIADQDVYTTDVSDPGRRFSFDLVEFIQHGEIIGYTEGAWLNYTFQTGTKMNQSRYRKIRKTLVDVGILVSSGRRKPVVLADNLMTDEAMRRIFHP